MRYGVRRVSPLSALLYGLSLGLVGWLLPGLLIGWLARVAVVQFRQWLAALNFVIPVPLTEGIPINLVPLLGLSPAQAQLASLAGRETTLLLAVMLLTAAAGMLLTGLTTFVGALLYNLLARIFGGLQITLDALDEPATGLPVAQAPRAAARPPVTSPAPVVPPPAANPARAGRPTPHAWLVPVTPGERWALNDDVTRIGSAPDNDIVLPGLSPQHAEIRRESGRYLIYDLGSRRTWVNDVQVAAVHMLKDGFRLQLGQAEFLVQIVAV